MGNYRQHITFASGLGIFYAAGAFLLMGVHWFYGTVATLLTTLSGLLPDLDSASGVELKGFTGILGVLAAVAVWSAVGSIQPTPIFEVQLWAMVLAYVLVRHGLRRVLSRLATHRGISHSLPTCGVWGLATYLYYPSHFHGLRLLMYGLLSYLAWLAIRRWPDDPAQFDLPRLDVPIDKYAAAILAKIRQATRP
jgi:hypothetical protein